MENMVGRVLGLADLAAYQEGTVVSRTIIDRKTGTVTLFAFDEGQGLSEHTAPFDALVYLGACRNTDDLLRKWEERPKYPRLFVA